jgi:hypothetical protein
MVTRYQTKNPSKSKSKRFFRKNRRRNFRAEYQLRIARGKAQGKSLSESRGHPRAGEGWAAEPITFDPKNPFEKALKLMKGGTSQREAAKAVGVSAERLRRFQKQNTTSRREGRRWVITDTRSALPMVMATRGKMHTVTVSVDATSDIGRHWVAINKFLETNDPTPLEPFVGLGLRDVSGRFHPFETRPNVLRRMDSAGELSFVDIYRQTAQ